VVEAITVVDVMEQGARRLVVVKDNARYVLEIDGACSTDRFKVGEVAFYVSPAEAAGRPSGLIFTLEGAECLVTEAGAP
jgi:hypothetical protein